MKTALICVVMMTVALVVDIVIFLSALRSGEGLAAGIAAFGAIGIMYVFPDASRQLKVEKRLQMLRGRTRRES